MRSGETTSQTNANVVAEIVLAPDAPTFSNAVLRVRISNVTYVGSAAPVMADAELRNLSHHAGSESRWTLILTVSHVDPSQAYGASAHMNLAGDGRIAPSDYISMESHPVLTYGHPNRVIIRLRRVE